MKNLILGLLCLLPLYSIAQKHDLSKANTGYVYTNTDSIYGRLTVDMKSNTIWVKREKSLINLTAKQVKKAVYFNENGEIKMLAGGHWGTYTKSFLFEILVDGDLPLLYREGLKFDPYDETSYPPYFVQRKGAIFSLGNKKEILKILGDHKSTISFVKNNKLKLKDKNDFIKLFSFANGQSGADFRSIAIEEE